jgi:serine protease Do
MDNKNKYDHDIIDKDLYEEFDDEQLLELVDEARKEALEKARRRKEEQKSKQPFPKWLFWLIAVALVINIVGILPQTFSIPAVEFLKTSAKLSQDETIKQYKRAVVVIETDSSKGTGFSFNERGDILTNYHVIEGEQTVTVAFPDLGLFQGEVTETYPDVDLAVVKIEGENMPHLTLADQFYADYGDPIYFIGNPLSFNGIANEGTVIDWTYVSSKEEPVIMLDAPVYRGNSGSPVINQNGKVIGVIFATLYHDEHGRVGLFVPIDYYFERSKENSS